MGRTILAGAEGNIKSGTLPTDNNSSRSVRVCWAGIRGACRADISQQDELGSGARRLAGARLAAMAQWLESFCMAGIRTTQETSAMAGTANTFKHSANATALNCRLIPAEYLTPLSDWL